MRSPPQWNSALSGHDGLAGRLVYTAIPRLIPTRPPRGGTLTFRIPASRANGHGFGFIEPGSQSRRFAVQEKSPFIVQAARSLSTGRESVAFAKRRRVLTLGN